MLYVLEVVVQCFHDVFELCHSARREIHVLVLPEETKPVLPPCVLIDLCTLWWLVYRRLV